MFSALLRPFATLIFGLLLLVAGSPSLAGPAPHYKLAGQEKPVALLHTGRNTFLVTEHDVWQLAGKQLVRRYQSAARIQCAAAADTVLWLGTTQGALRLGTRQFRVRPLALPGMAGEASISALCRDATGAIWVGAVGYGVFRLPPSPASTVEKALSLPTVSAALATADSSVWIGSNLGLHRFQHQQWTRYNEEGVANLEIPDNLVEKLLPDNAGNLWVLMSAGISVFPATGAAALVELPTTTFLGRPGNAVFSVAYLPGTGRVFATAMGLLLLPDAPAGPFASFEASASTDKVEPKRMLLPLTLPGGVATPPQLVQLDPQGRVWLVSSDEVRVLSQKEFRQLAQTRRVG